MDNFTTVFEITKGDNDTSIHMLLIGIFFFILGVVVLIIKKKRRGRWLENLYIPLFLLVSGLFLSLIGGSDLINYNKIANDLVSAYRNNQYKVVEGTVHVLYEQPKSGHTKGDIISIDGKEFEINYFIRTRAYHKTISHGGALNEGVYARVYHYKEKILQVDVLREECSDRPKLESELTNRPNTINERDSIPITWKDGIWIACIVAVNVLFFMRKIILAKHGYGIGFLDYGMDHKRFRSIATNEISSIRRLFFTAINILIPVLFISALIGVILVRLVFD